MNINKAFKLWWNGVGKFFHKEIKKDAYTAGYKQSHIDTLVEIQTKLKVPIEFEWEETVEEYIDTELKKAKSSKNENK